MSRRKGVGILYRNKDNLVDTLVASRTSGYNFICISPVLKSEHIRNSLEGNVPPLTEPMGWFDIQLNSTTTDKWYNSVVGICNDLSDYLESEDQIVAHRARNLLRQELDFCHHVGLPAIMVDLKMGISNANLARTILSFSTNVMNNHQIWVKLPMVSGQATDPGATGDGVGEQLADTPWNWWHKFHALCDYGERIYAALEMTSDLPDDEEVQKWLGEPVVCIILPADCFICNKKGFPVLASTHQRVLKQFLEMGVQAVIDATKLSGTNDSMADARYYRQYIDFVGSTDWRASIVPDPYADDNVSGYEDYLQTPLQPLQDNLESNTYEVFERDPVKYELYMQAIRRALIDLVPEAEVTTKTVVVMVVGAGRGPIVHAARRAAIESGRMIRVYAVEKNANAANTLHHMNRSRWEGQVTVVNVDMRDWEAPEQADIIVSELLGSFADNELSPECLDGVQKHLKSSGVMIPQSYRSYIAPVMSSKLYNEARRCRDQFKNPYCHFEMPYVVHMKNKHIIADPKLLFTFTHPKPDISQTNDRYGTESFTSKSSCVVNGIAGFFECTLYKDVLMSILPATFSTGMFSWFPIFFPIRDPINVMEGDQIGIHFWRCSSRTAVWYEWAISSPNASAIHNPNGRSYMIGL